MHFVATFDWTFPFATPSLPSCVGVTGINDEGSTPWVCLMSCTGWGAPGRYSLLWGLCGLSCRGSATGWIPWPWCSGLYSVSIVLESAWYSWLLNTAYSSLWGGKIWNLIKMQSSLVTKCTTYSINWTRTWPASNEARINSSVGRALHWYHGGYSNGFESCWSLWVFSGLYL